MATVAPRYARAFAEVVEADRLDTNEVERQARDFSQTLAGSNALREVLENPSIEMPDKLRVLDGIATRIVMFYQVRNFLAVVVQHHRLRDLEEILANYRELIDEHADAVEAQITSARALNDADRALLEAEIAKLSGARVRATYSEDARLLGGAIVEIGSKVYDGSVRAQLQQLQQRLVNA